MGPGGQPWAWLGSGYAAWEGSSEGPRPKFWYGPHLYMLGDRETGGNAKRQRSSAPAERCQVEGADTLSSAHSLSATFHSTPKLKSEPTPNKRNLDSYSQSACNLPFGRLPTTRRSLALPSMGGQKVEHSPNALWNPEPTKSVLPAHAPNRVARASLRMRPPFIWDRESNSAFMKYINIYVINTSTDIFSKVLAVSNSPCPLHK